MSLPPKFIDFRAVKAAVTMEQVLKHYDLFQSLKQSGDNLSGCCPIHKGTNPTQFRVSLSKNCWNCFSDCQCGGNVLDFVAKLEKCGLREAALKLVDWFQIPLAEPEPSPRGQARSSAPRPKPENSSAEVNASSEKSNDDESTGLNKPLGFVLRELDAQHPYLTQRGLTLEAIAEFGLGLCSSGKTINGRIAIPIHNPTGHLVAYVGRWPGEPPDAETPKYKLPKGFKKSLEIFNLHRVLAEPAPAPLIIVEGFFDVIKLWQLGYRKSVALMGSSMSAAQEKLLADVARPHRSLVVLMDEDEAGRAGRADIVVRLAKFAFVRAPILPIEGQQPENLSAAELAELIA